MILLIDNYDSFTYNLFQQLTYLGANVKVAQNDQISLREAQKINPQKIIISPGPKNPNYSGISIPIIKKFYQKIPILGVCLGHQCIGQLFGSKIIQAKKILHGKTSKIFHKHHGLFKNISSPVKVARYHSLVIDQLPKKFELHAWSAEKEIMAIKHKEYPLYGIQFHPESFMTRVGDKLIKNFVNE